MSESSLADRVKDEARVSNYGSAHFCFAFSRYFLTLNFLYIMHDDLMMSFIQVQKQYPNALECKIIDLSDIKNCRILVKMLI